MNSVYKIEDVTNDLKFLLTLTRIFEVDEEGFFKLQGEDGRFIYKLDNNDPGKPIVIFQDPLPQGDYYFFNPFAESFGKKSPATLLFYKSVFNALNVHIRTAMLYVLQSTLNAKIAEAEKRECGISSAVLRMSSVPIDKKTTLYDLVDEELMKEFETLCDRINDEFIVIPYISNIMTAQVKCYILNDKDWDSKYSKDIRKKSLQAFKTTLMGVLGIEKPDEIQDFTVKYNPDLKSSAKLHTTLEVVLKLYGRFNDILAQAYAIDDKLAYHYEIPLGELTEVIERLPLAYAIAKHMIQPSYPVRSEAVSLETTDTSGLKLGGDNRFTPSQKRFSSPMIVDKTPSGIGGGLNIGSPAGTQSRFAPRIISDTAQDPFSPIIKPVNNNGFNPQFSSLFNQPMGGGLNLGSSPSLNLNPPSNFGFPNTRPFG